MMASEMALRRRFFAEEIEAVSRLRTSVLVEAFARVARDQFLPPGPWTVLSDGGDSYAMGSGGAARVVSVVAVYSALGIRDHEMNDRIGKAMMAGPARWLAVTRLRRDAHELADSCWLHGRSCCISTM